MTQLAQSTPVAADHTAEIARLNDAARAGSLPTSRTVFTRALADILAGDAEDPGARQASLFDAPTERVGNDRLDQLEDRSKARFGGAGLRRARGLRKAPDGSED